MLLNYLALENLFLILVAVVTFSIVWVWLMILLSQVMMRRHMTPAEVATLAFPVPFWPIGPALGIAFMLFIFGVLAWFPDTRTSLFVGLGWLALLSVGYWLFIGRSARQAAVASKAPQANPAP